MFSTSALSLNDCFLHDKDRIKHAEALSILRQNVKPLGRTKKLNLSEVSSRIIAENITAPHNVPLSNNAAVDGYAFYYANYKAGTRRFRIASRLAAGNLSQDAVSPSDAARIFTGATLPEGFDCIAMQEDCKKEEIDDLCFVTLPPGLKKGANCRLAGEDVKQGDTLFVPGKRLNAADIAALASIGRDKISVFQRVRLALFSTGNELVEPGQAISHGQVYDANAPLLESLAGPLPVHVTNAGIVKDDLNTISATLSDLAETHDVVLTTGGASRGDEDHILTALDTLGKRHLWQLAIKPGRPMTFGQIGKATFIGLPGNPVAAFVCFLLYARPVLLALGGSTWETPQGYELPAAFSLANKKTNRREFQRGILREHNGQLVVDKFKRDGSGLIAGLREADGLIELDEKISTVKQGDMVRFIPFSSFGL